MRELRQLKLPQLVEARRRAESENGSTDSLDISLGSQSLHRSRSSTSLDAQPPLSPTYSLRGHSRLPSSSSSLASSPKTRESLDGYMASKRPLTQVMEALEKDEDGDDEMLDRSDGIPNGTELEVRTYVTSENRSVPNVSFAMGYDWGDSTVDDISLEPVFSAKRRCADENVSSNFTRLESRFPSFSRRWKARTGGTTASVTESIRETVVSRSRSSSLRSPSIIDSALDLNDRGDNYLPPTPARSVFEEGRDEGPVSPIDIQKANAFHDHDVEEAEDQEILATTPLLPPLMVEISSKLQDQPFQSPLQSPKIADSPSALHSTIGTPIEMPRNYGLPSPPLSTRPSIASFHHRQMPPSSEIPQIYLADPQDEWANKLGHVNFTIHPEPYLPETFDFVTCKQLQDDWDAARLNFMKHLARTRENYSTTSKVHQLTEEKWAQIDALWAKNHEVAKCRALKNTEKALDAFRQASVAKPMPSMQLPSLNGPKSEGKFPKLGDEGIVGPMVQEKSQLSPRSKGRKRAFWKFLQGVLPTSVAFGRA
ncbi:MAG: hypothetical protein MMC33_008282 [Icmadophila ericetorum]|nr:hypothetical protein [Icmadophila ericetorum]